MQPQINSLGRLIVELFRLNGLLLAKGDELTRDLGLSSARWQVLGALELAGQPLTVSQIARNMGLTRQAVQRVADELHDDGYLTFSENPNHARAKHASPTPAGNKAFQKAMQRQSTWVNALLRSAHISQQEVRDGETLLRTLRETMTHESRVES